MNRHASMNRVYRLIWSSVRDLWIPVAETSRGRGKRTRRTLVAAALSLAAALAHAAGPSGGQVTAGSGTITQSGAVTTITQDSSKLSLSWTSFNITPQETVDFVQPSASAIAVNRIFDTNGTQILGHLNANGQVFLINPNGIVFGAGAVVNVGGLVAAALDLNQASLDAASKSFSGNSADGVVNEGTITAAPGGYVVLLGNHVNNQGVISAQLGSVALAAGSAATLTFNNNSLVHLQVDQSLWHSLAENSGVIQADGGQVIMTAGAKDALVASVVNNTGVIEARTVQSREGTITLLGGMADGTVTVGGTLDASAPSGGNGGSIETSAAHVEVADGAKVTTAAASGLYGGWLIDPTDFNVAASGGNITGAQLSTDLGTTNVNLKSSSGTTGVAGNVNVNDAVSWSADTTLTLTASNDVNVNANITTTGNTAGLIILPNTANGGQTASGTGIYTLLNGASITLSGATPSLSIASIPYIVINSLGVAGSMTGKDVQGINGGLAGHYALGSNLNASATSSWNGGAGFTPIGTLATPFTGIFDGLGHSITSLNINLPTTNNVGFFGYIGAGAVVRNVGLLGGSVTGNSDVGGLAGYSDGAISNGSATGSVSGGPAGNIGGLVGANYGAGTIGNSYATGSVSGAAEVGGLVGINYGPISNSHATGAVTGTAFGVGGLVGFSVSAAISNSYATGSVSGGTAVGGLVGLNTNSGATISNSYATGSVAGSTYVGGLVGEMVQGSVLYSYSTGAVSGSSHVGGLVGYGVGTGAPNSNSTVTDSYWDTDTSGQSTSAQTSGTGGGAVVVSSLGGLTTAQMQTATNFVGFNFTANPGTPGNNWVMIDTDGTLNNNMGTAAGATFPMLASEYSTIVTNAHQLQLMAMNLAASYTLGQNIDASASALAVTTGSSDIWSTSGGFIPIGSQANAFTGATFNGLGYSISGLTINLPATDNVGLFGLATGLIENVGLLGGSVTGHNNVGGLVGYNLGTVNNSYATGSVSGNSYVGGLVGFNDTAISNSYAAGSVSGVSNVGGLVGINDYATINNSYATGPVHGTGGNVGGLVGYGNYGSVTNSHATGTVTGTTAVGGLVGFNYGGANGGMIDNSYATGHVSGTSGDVGGLVGYADFGAITNSYATASVTGVGNVGGLVGYNEGSISDSHAGIGGVIGTGSYVGGLVGLNINGGAISNSYATGNVTGSNYAGGLAGGSTYTISTIDSSYATGAVTGYAIVGGLVGRNAGTISNSYATGRVSGNSEVGGLAGWSYGAITASHATGAVSASGNQVGGLVGFVNAAVSDSYATGAVSGSSYVGGLLGTAETEGTPPITNTYATGAVSGSGSYVGGLVGFSAFSISNGHASGAVSGAGDVGGLVGYNGYTISDSYATGNVSGTAKDVGGLAGYNGSGTITTSYATGTVIDSGSIAGGLVGGNYGAISNSYATGKVNSGVASGGLVGGNYGMISNSYATGKITGTGNALGGLVGDNAGAVTASFWNSDINATGIGSGTSAGASGLSTAGMMTMSNFSAAGWSISDIGGSSSVWRIYQGNTAPLLLSFMTPLTVTAANATKTYTGIPVASLAGAGYSLAGAATSGHIFNDANTYNGAVNVGSYAPDLYSDQQGYDISYIGGTLTITPATLTVTATAATKTYGQANPALCGSVTGFVDGETLASATTGSEIYSTPATLTSTVGTYAITGSGLSADNGNYIFAFAAGDASAFSITPATLTYTAAAASFAVGQTPSGLSGTLSGFVLGQTQANATAGTLDWTTGAGISSPPGRYAIDGSGLTAMNYVFVEAGGNASALTLRAGSAAGPSPAMLLQAQIAVGTLEADLPDSETTIQLAPLYLAQDSTNNGIVEDDRVVLDARLPSLRVVRGGVKLPDNGLDIDAR